MTSLAFLPAEAEGQFTHLFLAIQSLLLDFLEFFFFGSLIRLVVFVQCGLHLPF